MRYNSSIYTDLTDEELIQLVRDGNETAFAQLASRHSFQIWQLVVLNSRQTRDAEEIFQDIWISVWENIGGLREVSSFDAWLRKIAYTACKRYYTVKSNTHGEILQTTEKLAETIDRDALVTFREMELQAAAREAVHHLPEKVRAVAALYYLESWTVKEISEELSLAVGTVKTRLRDIRRLLRTEFDVEEVMSGKITARERKVSTPAREKIQEGFGMELTLERDDILAFLQRVQGVVDGQDALPVRIRAEEGTISLEVSLRMKVEGKVKAEGAIAVPAQKLMETLKALPADKQIDLVAAANDTVEISCGDGVYKIIGTSDEELAQPPSAERAEFSIGGATLRDVIQKTEYAASTEKDRSFLKGLYFNFLDDRTEIVATDGKRLALAHCEPFNLQREANGFIVPLEAVQEIPKTFGESVEVEVSVSENQALLTDGNATLKTPLVGREYPDYHKIIPKTHAGKTVVSREQILSVARRMGEQSNPKNHAICLEIDTERIRVSAKKPESAITYETMPVESGTGSIRIGFDSRLLIDSLSHIDTESVLIEFSRELEPVLIKPIGDDRYFSLLMPLRLEFLPS